MKKNSSLDELIEITGEILRAGYASAEFAFLSGSFVRGEAAKVIEMTEELLAPHGGFLFDGLRLDAPADWRNPIE
jgi:hypothetical protein